MIENSSSTALSPKIHDSGDCVPERLAGAIAGWNGYLSSQSAHHTDRMVIGILKGEGIGSELMAVIVDLLDTISGISGNFGFDIRLGGLIGFPARERSGRALTTEVSDWCRQIYRDNGAILCGPGGSRFVYEMRTEFDLFCKFTPIRPFYALHDCGVLKKEAIDDVDMVIVRENTSGVYFGSSDRFRDEHGVEHVTHTFSYQAAEIHRILEVSINLAKSRRNRITLVVKPGGVEEISKLWSDIFLDLTAGTGMEADILEIDHASYQIIASANSFDVIVTPNLFGDILSDGAALLLGSRGMSYSGNFGTKGVATYQTGHGAAHKLAGTDTANPIGQILSTSMMLRESFGLLQEAAMIETAISHVLQQNLRTADIASAKSLVVGTREIGDAIIEALISLA